MEVFGRGNVNTGIVGGVDLSKPYGHFDDYRRCGNHPSSDLARI